MDVFTKFNTQMSCQWRQLKDFLPPSLSSALLVEGEGRRLHKLIEQLISKLLMTICFFYQKATYNGCQYITEGNHE